MDAQNIKAVALLSGLTILSGCGGGGDNKDKYYEAPSLNPIEVAQVAAAIQTAKTTFDVVMYDGQGAIKAAIEEGRINKNIQCFAGSYKVTPNTKTAYNKDGLIAHDNCQRLFSSTKGGAIDFECLDAKCTKSITTATGASYYRPSSGIHVENVVLDNPSDSDIKNAVPAKANSPVELKINGDLFSDTYRDGFRGNALIDVDGKVTRFDFADSGLVQEYFNNGVQDGFGRLKILDGKNNACIDGTYAYDVSSNLVIENNSLRVIAGAMKILDAKDRELGVVNFTRDGGVSVKTRSGATVSLTPNQFESYCGLSEAYRFSKS